MSYKSIKYYNFRNIKDTEIIFAGKKIFFIGKNGQGKTNLLESIYLLSYGNSFKKKSEQDFIKYGNNESAIIGKSSDDVIKFNFSNSSKSIYVNDKIVTDRKDIIKKNPVIMFSYDDINIISGEPELRRKFINQLIFLTSDESVYTYRKFYEILKTRNNILKKGEYKLLDVIDIQFSQAIKDVNESRIKLIEEINRDFYTIWNEVTGIKDKIVVHYQKSVKGETFDSILAELKNNRENDIRLQSSTKGPHRDNIIFLQNNIDFSKYASTGQKRILSLILKIFQADYVKKKNKNPILLIDDVILELDGQKRKKIVSLLPHNEQMFFTFLPEENYKEYVDDETQIFKIDQGEIK